MTKLRKHIFVYLPAESCGIRFADFWPVDAAWIRNSEGNKNLISEANQQLAGLKIGIFEPVDCYGDELALGSIIDDVEMHHFEHDSDDGVYRLIFPGIHKMPSEASGALRIELTNRSYIITEGNDVLAADGSANE